MRTPLMIREIIPLAPLTTFGVGGAARYFVEVKSEDELREALAFAEERALPVFILGSGSNILVADEGFPGLVVHISLRSFEILLKGERALVKAAAGENWDDVVQRCVADNLAGIECLSGIPGTVGAAPVQNIGAYGTQLSSTLRTVRVFDRETHTFRELSNFECRFSYRDSVFKQEGKRRYVITAIMMELSAGAAPRLVYHDLVRYFAERRIVAPTLEQVRRAVIEIRNRKGMVLLPGYERFASAGSFFRNPVVNESDFERVREAVLDSGGASLCATPWFWKTSTGSVKVSAACLIQCAGFTKGFREGNAGISPKHALALVNCGGATATEIAGLGWKIRKRVHERFGVLLEPEVEAIGFATDPFSL